MAVNSAEADYSKAIDELSYRETQAKLKELGIPAKGSHEVLKIRLADKLREIEGGPSTEDPAKENYHHNSSPASPTSSPRNLAGPSKLRKAGKKSKPSKEVKVKSPKQQRRYIVTTEVMDDDDTPDASIAHEQELKLESATKIALPDADITVERIPAVNTPGNESPLQRVTRVARDSAANLQHSARDGAVKLQHTARVSASKFQQSARNGASELKRSAGDLQRRLGSVSPGWLWPALAALLLALLLSAGYSVWKDSHAWKKHISQQVDVLQQSVSSAYNVSQAQAAKLNENLNWGYSYARDGISNGTSRLAEGAQSAMESGSSYASDAYGRALQYLPSTKRIRAYLPTSACSARLNATALEVLIPSSAAWAGVGISLNDAWGGLKDDPYKGAGILLAGSSKAALHKATATIEGAVPPDCKHCYLHLQGEDWSKGGLGTAGQLQLRLAEHLEACPYAIIVLEGVNLVHADALTPLLSVLSELGSLAYNGKSIPAYKAIYMGTTVVPASILEKTDEEEFAAAVKRDLVFQLQTPVDNLAVPEAFRRRWDLVAPLN